MKFSKFSFVVFFVLCCALIFPGVVSAAPVLNPLNGHYYDIITGQPGIRWSEAKIAAESLTYEGLSGHLVTITSPEEQDFINANFGIYFDNVAYFLGGFKPVRSSDPAAGWTWVTGEPWVYTNWAPEAPNDCYGGDDGITPWCSNEDALEKYHANGDWNDYPSGASERNRVGYIVEYEKATPAPEFPSAFLPATMIIGFLGAVLLIQRTKEH